MILNGRFDRLQARPAMIGAILLAMTAVLFASFRSSEIQPAGSAERTQSIQFWQALEATADAADFVPAEPADFAAIEAKCVERVPKLQSAVVGVFSPSSAVLPRIGPHRDRAGSGVVISADGLVLSQFHVTHAIRAPVLNLSQHHLPGEETLVVFSDGIERKAVRLNPDHWTQSRNFKTEFAALTAPLRTSVITILNGSVPVALGTVVDQKGLSVCKASTLPSHPRCRLPDDRIVEANIVGVDKAFDLAVLQIPPESVRPVAWLDGDSPPVGRIVGITVGQSNPANGWAIPPNSVQRIIKAAKDGKLERWPER